MWVCVFVCMYGPQQQHQQLATHHQPKRPTHPPTCTSGGSDAKTSWSKDSISTSCQQGQTAATSTPHTLHSTRREPSQPSQACLAAA